ncbi:MAG: SpoIIE family protein phosphatase [Butyricicoccaceae bacterium]
MLCLLLADGMGSGAAAAQDSRMLVSSMERFLRAGIPLGDALGAVSPALRLRSDGTRFVTLDALTLDLFTGQAESLKCGAALLLCAHGWALERARRKSLPVGLSDEKNQSQSVPLRLSHGDLFIMVSDGVSDGLDDAWVRELLREHGGEGPKELAARLVTEARGRGSDDDRTAIVMRVEKTQF